MQIDDPMGLGGMPGPSAVPNPFNAGFYPHAQEAEPEQGYPPPDPALYDYYASDPQMQAFMQAQQKPQFTFMRRINKMNWDLMANIDVETIARTGDVASIEYLMQPLAFANITQQDTEYFGTRASLHAFLILQMAVEVLMAKLANIPANAMPQQPPPQQVTPHQVAQYEAKIDLLNKDIRSRDLIINNLTERLRLAEQGRDEAYAQIQSIQSKRIRPPSHVDAPTLERPKQETMRARENDEAGLDHMDTEYMEYLQERPHKYRKSKPVKKSHHKERKHKRDTSSCYESETSASSGWT